MDYWESFSTDELKIIREILKKDYDFFDLRLSTLIGIVQDIDLIISERSK